MDIRGDYMSITSTTNRLANEKSPYLLQHAHNPVDWYPWGDEAFNKAKSEDKPIFLSIGYSTCHWCHVMEGESFEDQEVADLMNQTFVSIKVDKEERPDIDNIYMAICQAMTGSGGWPLTIFMTPEKKPFFSATYIPKESKYGRMGMMDLIKKVDYLWSTDKKSLVSSAEKLARELHNIYAGEKGKGINQYALEEAVTDLGGLFDEQYGGFGTAPKFPSPHNLLFLLRDYKRNNNKDSLNMVTKTLDAMAMGGIFDHVGFGFHRYSTDRKWLLPHFEKMLYDQAMIALAYIETYEVTQNDKYKLICDRIFEYIMSDMKSREGAFYSAEDADSEGVEGKFYVWRVEGIRKILNEEDAKLAVKMYGMKEEGNFRDEATGKLEGLNILHFEKDLEVLSKELNLSEAALKARLEKIRRQLKEARDKRIRPSRDEKILTDWNGLIIAALARGGRIFNNEEYIKTAEIAANFFLNSIKENGRLLHRYIDGQWNFKGNIDDYAFLVFGLLELYEATFDLNYLKEAFSLNNEAINLFWDDEQGGFYFTPKDGEDIIIRTKEVYDGAIPSGNSIQFLNLIKLSRISGDSKLENYADELQKVFSRTVEGSPLGYTQFLCAVDYLIGPSYEIVISGDRNSEDTKKMLRQLNRSFVPNKVVIFNPINEEDSELIKIAPYVKDEKAVKGKATAYICKNFTCGRPITDADEMLKSLNS
ncbi:thioredoxin domain-containing protein [Clostridium neuense]|uniref:Thioredoxin domain-containing protein n=2 Tax=Clostridium neuense TaxID=1728934 RepID=A0ABW8TEV8_9CLOT